MPLNLTGRGMSSELHEAYGEELEMLAADFASAQARQDPTIVQADLKALLQRTGAVLDPSSDEYHEAGLAILRAHVRAYELKLERQRGKIVATPAPSADRGPKLSEAFEAWKTGSGTRGSRKPSPKTLLEAVYAVRRFTEWHGDARLGDITRAMGREFALALAKVPTGLPDSLRQTPLRELVKKEKELAHLPPVHSGTINKSLNILSAIVSHAEAGGGLDAVPGGFRNPFGKGVKLDTDRREADPRQPFSAADLKSIFGVGVFRDGDRPTGGAGEAAYWLPLLALLSGARQGELAQLRVMDLAEDAESGVWYLDIGTAGGRSIKTASSQRRVPLHPALVDIGLLRYRAGLVAAGAKPEASLWPALNIEREAQPAGAWSKWFTRFLRKTVGIEDPTKVFHSFRHTLKRMARDAGLHEEMHDALTGHAGGGGVGRGYGRGFGLKAMAAEMAKIEVPEVVRGLRWSATGPGEARRQ